MEHGLERPLGFWHLVLTLSVALLIRLCECNSLYFKGKICASSSTIWKQKSSPHKTIYFRRKTFRTARVCLCTCIFV